MGRPGLEAAGGRILGSGLPIPGTIVRFGLKVGAVQCKLRGASFALAVTLVLDGCSKSEPPAPSSASPTAASRSRRNKDPEAAKALIASGAVVIDVRTAEEFAGEHVANAINIPVEELAKRLAEVDQLVASDKAKPVVVYCQSGHRAVQAKRELERAGYSRVVNGGGVDDLL